MSESSEKYGGIGCLVIVGVAILLSIWITWGVGRQEGKEQKKYSVDSEELGPITEGEDLGEKESSSSSALDWELVQTQDLSSPVREVDEEKTKKRFFVLLKDDIDQADIRNTAQDFIEERTVKNPELDEAIIEFCSTRHIAEKGATHDVAQAVWAPLGELGNTTKDIIQSNDRSSYRIKVDYNEGFDKSVNKGKTGKKFDLTLKERREFFKKWEEAEFKAMKKADRKYRSGTNKHRKAINRFTKRNKNDLLDKWGLTREQAEKIFNEGLNKGW
jgi:hypothetical protein